MNVRQHSFTKGIYIDISMDEIAIAIDAYLVAHGIVVRGPRTISIEGLSLSQYERVHIYVDPSGFVIDADGNKFNGNEQEQENNGTD